MFEMDPSTYLLELEPDWCQIKIEKNTLPDGFDQIYLVGDTLLAHFYSAYNFDKNTVSLGVNTHSSDHARIFDSDLSSGFISEIN